MDCLMYLDPPDIRDTELYNQPPPAATATTQQLWDCGVVVPLAAATTSGRPAADRKRPLEEFLERNYHATRNANT